VGDLGKPDCTILAGTGADQRFLLLLAGFAGDARADLPSPTDFAWS
jgi:hypothetical protein